MVIFRDQRFRGPDCRSFTLLSEHKKLNIYGFDHLRAAALDADFPKFLSYLILEPLSEKNYQISDFILFLALRANW